MEVPWVNIMKTATLGLTRVLPSTMANFVPNHGIVLCLHPVVHAKRAGVPSIKDQLGTSERSVVRLISPKVLKEARHCQSVLRTSFSSRSSSSEVKAKRPVGADKHGNPCSTDAKSLASPQLVRRGGRTYDGSEMGDDRQTDPEIKHCGPIRVCADAFHASVTWDPRQNKK